MSLSAPPLLRAVYFMLVMYFIFRRPVWYICVHIPGKYVYCSSKHSRGGAFPQLKFIANRDEIQQKEQQEGLIFALPGPRSRRSWNKQVMGVVCFPVSVFILHRDLARVSVRATCILYSIWGRNKKKQQQCI